MNASRRSKEELPSKTGWLFKVNILSVVTGPQQAQRTPPIRMLEMGVPVGAGTDATRVSSTTHSFLSTGWSQGRRSVV